MSGAGFTPGPWAAIKGVEVSDEMRCGVSAMRGDVGYLVATIENGAPGDICDTEYANARLIAAAPDHALICWAMCVQDGTWEEWGEGKGEFCFAGLRHATKIDEFGSPELTLALRDILSRGFADWCAREEAVQP